MDQKGTRRVIYTNKSTETGEELMFLCARVSETVYCTDFNETG